MSEKDSFNTSDPPAAAAVTTPPANANEAEKVIKPLQMPTIEEVRGQDIWNNCAIRSVASGIMGGGLGIAMGLFLGALDNPITDDKLSGRQQFINTAKTMGSRSWSSCKAFAVMGLVFSAAECVVEKASSKLLFTSSTLQCKPFVSSLILLFRAELNAFLKPLVIFVNTYSPPASSL